MSALDTTSDPRGGIAPDFVLVVIVLAAVVLDRTSWHGNFVPSRDYLDNSLFAWIAAFAVCVVLWLRVYRAARARGARYTDEAVQSARGGNWFMQPILAIPILAVIAVIAASHSAPKLIHRVISGDPVTLVFEVAGPPGPADGGCSLVMAARAGLDEAQLCVPPIVGAEIADLGPSGVALYASGTWTWFGFLPDAFSLTPPDRWEAQAATDGTPPASPGETVRDPDLTPPVPPVLLDDEIGTDVKRILEEMERRMEEAFPDDPASTGDEEEGGGTRSPAEILEEVERMFPRGPATDDPPPSGGKSFNKSDGPRI